MTTQETLEDLIVELAKTHKERLSLIKGLVVALVAKQHLLMVGPGGTGKTFLIWDLSRRVTDAAFFEQALDETSDPSAIFGPVDIRAMREGIYRRDYRGMAPEAHIAFIDEFFNGNGPVWHSMMPWLNERVFHNGREKVKTPLWSCFMGTNKLNVDEDYAATWDRIHQRWKIDYVQHDENIRSMVEASLRRRVAGPPPMSASITLEQLRAAHIEALSLPIAEEAWEAFLELRQELVQTGVVVGSRRQAEGMQAAAANAWLNGHHEVQVGDLDVLAHMWWIKEDQRQAAQKLILGIVNPGEREAMKFLDDIQEMRAEMAARAGEDQAKRRLLGMEHHKNLQRIQNEAQQLLGVSTGSTLHLDEALRQAEELEERIKREVYAL